METNSAPHPSKEPWIWSPWTPRSLCSSSWVHFSSVKWGRCLTSARSVAVSNITRSGTRLVLAAGTRIPLGNRNYFIEENGSTSAQGEGEDPVTRAHERACCLHQGRPQGRRDPEARTRGAASLPVLQQSHPCLAPRGEPSIPFPSDRAPGIRVAPMIPTREITPWQLVPSRRGRTQSRASAGP